MSTASLAVQAVDNAVSNIVKSRRSLAQYRDKLTAVRGDLVKLIKSLCPTVINADWSSNEYSNRKWLHTRTNRSRHNK